MVTTIPMPSPTLHTASSWPRDAVAGIPTEYGDAVTDNTLSLLATITTTEDLLSAWNNR